MLPYESSLPIVLANLALAAIALGAWLKTQARSWLVIAFITLSAALAVFVADRLVETDREHLRALFPRLAAAAERQDIDSILASLDPDLRPLRADAERVLKQVRPTEVSITKLDVSLASPETANVDLIVRVTGNILDKGTRGTTITGLRVTLVKKGRTWLVTDAEVQKPVRAGQRPS